MAHDRIKAAYERIDVARDGCANLHHIARPVLEELLKPLSAINTRIPRPHWENCQVAIHALLSDKHRCVGREHDGHTTEAGQRRTLCAAPCERPVATHEPCERQRRAGVAARHRSISTKELWDYLVETLKVDSSLADKVRARKVGEMPRRE